MDEFVLQGWPICFLIFIVPKDGFRAHGPQVILVFGAPRRCDLFGCLSENHENMSLLWIVLPQTPIFCSSFALDLQQKLKPFQWHCNLFLEFIALSCSQKFSSLNFRVFQHFFQLIMSRNRKELHGGAIGHDLCVNLSLVVWGCSRTPHLKNLQKIGQKKLKIGQNILNV